MDVKTYLFIIAAALRYNKGPTGSKDIFSFVLAQSKFWKLKQNSWSTTDNYSKNRGHVQAQQEKAALVGMW